MTNYRFKKECEQNKIVLRAQKVVVDKTNLTDELAEIILNTPGISHNVELIPGRTPDKKKDDIPAIAGEIPLPPSIVSALQEAKIEEKPLKKAQEERELNLNTLRPSTAKPTAKGKGKK